MTHTDHVAHILANGLRIPVRFFHESKCVLSFPEESQTLAEALKQDDWTGGAAPSSGQPLVAQFLANRFEENYIYLELEPCGALWLGPVLLRPMTDHRKVGLIRRCGLPIRRQNMLAEHFARLPVLTEDQFYYVGKLAESVIATHGSRTEPPSADAAEGAQPVFSDRRETAEGLLFTHPPYFLELEMTRLVSSGDPQSALAAMNRINSFNRAVLAKDPVRSLKNSLICNCTFLARAAIVGGVSPDDAFAASDRLIREIENTQTIPKLELLERENLIAFVELIHRHNTSYYSQPVRTVISYIHNHLGDALSLELLAVEARLHKNYLAGQFKKETGLPPMKYVQLQRIEESKFFLRYTDDSVLDIAMFYQFSSQSHFIQRFAKTVGMTPLQYRMYTGRRVSVGRK